MLALNAGPSWSRVMCSAGAMPGAATPIDWMSNPSAIAASEQSETVSQARLVDGATAAAPTTSTAPLMRIFPVVDHVAALPRQLRQART